MAAPVLAVGDGAPVLVRGPRGVPRDPRAAVLVAQIGSVLNALPKSAQPGAKKALAEIWNAEDEDHAQAAANVFAADYGTTWPTAAAKITDDLDVLLAFYDYPPSTGSTCAPPTRSSPPSPPSGFASESARAPAPAPRVSRWRSSSSNPHRPGGGPSTHLTSSRWSVPARYSRPASSSNDPTNQRVVISKSRDTPTLTHRPPWPPPSRVPSPGYAYPQPLTRVTIVI
jgi:hypothetical protein